MPHPMQRSILPIAMRLGGHRGRRGGRGRRGLRPGVGQDDDHGRAAGSARRLGQRQRQRRLGPHRARDLQARRARRRLHPRPDRPAHAASPFDFGLPQEQQGEATGSGFVIDKAGTILTNAHVVDGATKVTVQFADKKSVDAKVLGKDDSTDLALLKVDPDGLELAPLTLGSAKGRRRSATRRSPSATRSASTARSPPASSPPSSARSRRPTASRSTTSSRPTRRSTPATPAARCIDATGKVIGINSQIATGGSGGSGNVGIGFAVPIDTAKKIIPQLKESGRVERGYLGISALTVDKTLADLNLPVDNGALVQTVKPGSPAAKAGIRGGDLSATLDNHADPARRRHHHQGRRQGDPHARRSRGGGGQRSRATRSRSRCTAPARSRPSRSRSASGPTPSPSRPSTTIGGVSNDAPRIKLCGITTRDDALLAVEAGAWAVG